MIKHLSKIIFSLLCLYCALGQTDDPTSVKADCPECYLKEKIDRLEAAIQKKNEDASAFSKQIEEKMESKMAEIERKITGSMDDLKRLIVLKSCKAYDVIPSSYVYKNFMTLDDKTLRHSKLKRKGDKVTYFEMHIAIKGNGSAAILLSPVPTPSKEKDDLVFEIVVGTSGNQETLVALSLQSKPPVKTASTPSILSADHFEYFYLKICDETLILGKEGQSTPLVTYNDSRVSTIKYFTFTYWSDTDVEFLVDCLPITAFS